ncbi:MAG: hypothetical protein RL189_87 [Pseudomonadota bacterium]|jgi:hypothetical protein
MPSSAFLFFCAKIAFFTSIFSPQAAEGNLDQRVVNELMRASDQYRGGLKVGVSWNITIDSIEDEEKSTSKYMVRAKGMNALAECLNPPRCKGEIFLFNNRNLWFLKSGVKKPVSISPRQRLSGQVANGDIAATNYARDYQANFEKEEQIEGQNAVVLLLKAKEKNVTYDQIRYWVAKQSKLALRADFLTLQGEVIKSATFEYKNGLVSAGKKIPFVSAMRINDAAFPKNVTTITYESPREEFHDDSIFNINNVGR